MATIPVPGSELRHVRKTITFTGAAGAGAVGTITLFTITGRVRLDRMSAFCTVSLVSTGGTGKISLGVASSTGALSSNKSADAIVANDWFTGASVAAGISTDILYSSFTVDVYLLSESLILTVGTADITSGTLVFDAWYRPITDDGALAGDDIDSSLVDAIWDEAQSGHTTAGTFGRYLDSQLATIAGYIDTEVAAIKAKTDSLTFSVAGVVDANVTDWKGATAPAMTGDAYARLGAPAGASVSADVAAVQADTDNIQTRIPAALVGGRMDSSVGAMAAAVITAAAIATDAIDADALASDAVTEIWGKAMTELSAAPAVTGTVLQALEWIFLLARNKLTQTATTQTLRNDADNANLSTSTVSDDGTTFTRGEWS